MTRHWIVRFDDSAADLKVVRGVLGRWAASDRTRRSWQAHAARTVHGAVFVEASAAERTSLAALDAALGALDGARLMHAAHNAPAAA